MLLSDFFINKELLREIKSRYDVDTVEQAKALSDEQLLKVRRFGKKALERLRNAYMSQEERARLVIDLKSQLADKIMLKWRIEADIERLREQISQNEL